jgi:hypothetical protein
VIGREAEFCELASEVAIGVIKVGIAARGQFIPQVEKPGCNGMEVGEMLHGLNPFRWWRALWPAGLVD